MEIPTDLVEHIKALRLPAVIAISGLGGSGKSTISKLIGNVVDAPVIGVDSFQKDGAFDTQYSLWKIMDYLRLEKEVLIPFAKGASSKITYHHFNPKDNSLFERRVSSNGKIIVEGVGLFRPELSKYFTYKIWVDCPIEIAIERGKKRDREEYNSPTDKLWNGIWEDNDLQYIKTWNPRDNADYIFPNS